MSVLVLVLGMVTAHFLTNVDSEKNIKASGQSIDKLKSVKIAIENYARQNHRYPCPADPSVSNTSESIDLSTGICKTAGTGILNFDADGAGVRTDKFLTGTIPCNTIGLSDNCNLDGNGNKMAYGINDAFARITCISDGGTVDPTDDEYSIYLPAGEEGHSWCVYDTITDENISSAAANCAASTNYTKKAHFILFDGGVSGKEAGVWNSSGTRLSPYTNSAGKFVGYNFIREHLHHLKTPANADKYVFKPNKKQYKSGTTTPYMLDENVVWGGINLTGYIIVAADPSPSSCSTAGALQCWGHSGTTSGMGLSTTQLVKSVSIGENIGCAIRKDDPATGGTNEEDDLYCWGSSNTGMPTAKVKEIKAGSDFACAITTSDYLRCWGTATAANVTDSSSGISTTNQQAKELLISQFNPKTGCIIDMNDNIKCWGTLIVDDGDGRQFQNSNTTKYMAASVGGHGWYTPSYGQLCAIRASTETNPYGLECWEAGDYSQVVTAKPALSVRFKEISLGVPAACGIVKEAGGGYVVDQVICWGNGMSSGITNNNTAGRSDPYGSQPLLAKKVIMGEEHACAIKLNDTWECWGSTIINPSSMYLDTTSGNSKGVSATVKSISLTSRESCIIENDDDTVCWGNTGGATDTWVGANYEPAVATKTKAVSAGRHGACRIYTP